MTKISPDQLSFAPQEPAPELVMDNTAAAAHIAKTARPVEYDDRASEAARDIDRASIDPSVLASLRQDTTPITKPGKQFELPGKNGRANHQQLPRPHEVQRGMSYADIDERQRQNRAGVATVRAALNPVKDQ